MKTTSKAFIDVNVHFNYY